MDAGQAYIGRSDARQFQVSIASKVLRYKYNCTAYLINRKVTTQWSPGRCVSSKSNRNWMVLTGCGGCGLAKIMTWTSSHHHEWTTLKLHWLKVTPLISIVVFDERCTGIICVHRIVLVLTMWPYLSTVVPQPLIPQTRVLVLPLRTNLVHLLKRPCTLASSPSQT